jgi:tetratricopeptide (TPR) repeat protein
VLQAIGADAAATRVSMPVPRVVLWGLLLVVYVAVLGRISAGDDARMDPMTVRPRAVESAIAEGRFADALPIVTELSRLHPDEPLVAYWSAAIYRGLGRHQDEVAAWERLVALSPTSEAACPSLGEAFERAGDRAAAVRAQQRCVDLNPRSVERLLDLAATLERAGQRADAIAAYRRAAALAPTHLIPAARLRELGGEAAEP